MQRDRAFFSFFLSFFFPLSPRLQRARLDVARFFLGDSISFIIFLFDQSIDAYNQLRDTAY